MLAMLHYSVDQGAMKGEGMSDAARPTEESVAREEAPSTWGSRLRLIGPGLVVAATGVGAGDMVSSLTAGTEYGTVLVWAVVLGAA